MKYYVKPTLFLGFGGSGALVLQRVRHDIIQRFSKDGKTVPACFRFLVFDIDDSSAQLDSNLIPFSSESGSELIITKVGNSFTDFEKEVSNSPKDIYKSISSWWPKGLGEHIDKINEEEPNQAYQIRSVGRAAFWLNNNTGENFRECFGSALNSIANVKNIEKVNKNFDKSLHVSLTRGFNIFVASSIAGGTGCGMLIDALANIKDILDTSGKRVRVSSFLLMPSCYGERLEGNDYKDAKINAYAILKEYDNLIRRNFTYQETYTKDCTVSFNKKLSSLTYLLGSDDEMGGNHGGQGKEIAAKISDLIINLILGFDSEIDKAKGILEKVSGEVQLSRKHPDHRVSKAYSSFGFKEITYPYSQLKKYLINYLRQCVMGDLANSEIDSDQIKSIKYLLVGDSENNPVWFEKLIPDFQELHVPFLLSTVENYAIQKRKVVLNNIFKDYERSLELIDKKLKSEETRFKYDNNKYQTKIATEWIEDQLNNILRKPAGGIPTLEKFLEELESRIAAKADKCNEEAKNTIKECMNKANVTKLKNDNATLKKIFLQSNREKKIRTLLSKLQSDMKKRLEAKRNEILGESCKSLQKSVVDPLKNIINISKMQIGKELQRSRNEKREIRDALKGSEKYVGCLSENFKGIEASVMEKKEPPITDAKEKLIENLFRWNIDYLGSYEKVIADEILPPTKNIFEVLMEEQDSDLSEYLSEAAVNASPLWDYSAGAGGGVDRYMLTGLSSDQYDQYLNIDPRNMKIVSSQHIGKYRILFIGMRHGVPAAHINEIEQCQIQYKAQKGMIEFGGEKYSAHLLREASDWSELFPGAEDNLSDSEVKTFLKICRKLWFDKTNKINILQKDQKGSWFTLSMFHRDSERFNGLKQITETFKKDNQLVNDVKKTIIECLHKEYIEFPSKFLSWSKENNLPESVEKKVKEKLGLG